MNKIEIEKNRGYTVGMTQTHNLAMFGGNISFEIQNFLIFFQIQDSVGSLLKNYAENQMAHTLQTDNKNINRQKQNYNTLLKLLIYGSRNTNMGSLEKQIKNLIIP